MQKEKRGFTILEMLTVIAVLGVLAAIVAPRLARYLRQAQDRECEATRVIVTRAEGRYVFEHEGRASSGVDELKSAGYIETLPRCTGGGVYAWTSDPGGGRRLACSVHGDTLPDSSSNMAPAVAASTAPPAVAGAFVPPSAPPKSAADCPAGTEFMPEAYDLATKYHGPACVAPCPPGQKRSSVIIDSCLRTGVAAPNTVPSNPKSAADCPPGMEFVPHLFNKATRTIEAVCGPPCPNGQRRGNDGLCRIVVSAPPSPASSTAPVRAPAVVNPPAQPSGGTATQPAGGATSTSHNCPNGMHWNDHANKCVGHAH